MVRTEEQRDLHIDHRVSGQHAVSSKTILLDREPLLDEFDLLFLSGVGPRERGTKMIPGVELNADGTIASYDIETQVRSVFQNVKWILEDSGSSWEKIALKAAGSRVSPAAISSSRPRPGTTSIVK